MYITPTTCKGNIKNANRSPMKFYQFFTHFLLLAFLFWFSNFCVVFINNEILQYESVLDTNIDLSCRNKTMRQYIQTAGYVRQHFQEKPTTLKICFDEHATALTTGKVEHMLVKTSFSSQHPPRASLGRKANPCIAHCKPLLHPNSAQMLKKTAKSWTGFEFFFFS